MSRRLAFVAASLAAVAMGSAFADSSSGTTGTSSDSAAVLAGKSAGRTIVVDVHSEIDPVMAGFVIRILDGAGANDLVVLDLNTFGGRIDAAVQIRDALLASRAKTAAFVDPRALSAVVILTPAT